MSEKLKTLNPDQIIGHISPDEIGEIYNHILDSVYEGKSDRVDGHPAKKFAEKVRSNSLYPFLTLYNDQPIACYSVQWYGEKIDMGGAAVLKGFDGKGIGKNLYLKAHEWALQNLGNDSAMLSGGSRLGASAYLAVNDCGRFPCWLPPFPSWGYSNEPLEVNNKRQHEFLLVSEKYTRENAFTPDVIYLPHDKTISKLISNLWTGLVAWQRQDKKINYKYSEIKTDDLKFILSKGDEERVRFDCKTNSDIGIEFDQMVLECFDQTGNEKKVKEIPITRGLVVDVEIGNPNSSAIQDFLINKGFVFCGIYPGINPILVSNPDGTKYIYQRAPVNIYGILRPGLKSEIRRDLGIPEIKHDRNVEKSFGTIYQSWLK